MHNIEIEDIIAKGDFPQDVIEYMREHDKFPPSPALRFKVKTFEFPSSSEEFTKDYIEDLLGIRPRYVGGVTFDPVSYCPSLEVVFDKFTLAFEMQASS